jgi:hypothetical protein
MNVKKYLKLKNEVHNMKHIKLFEQFLNGLKENVSFKYKYNDNPDMEELVNKAAQEMGIMTDLIYFINVDLQETVKEVVNSITGSSSFKLDKVMRKRTDDGDTMVYISYNEDSEQYSIFSNKEF